MAILEQCEGVIVRLQPYSESSLITTWITDRHGILQVLIRGARKPKQKQFEGIDLLNQAILNYHASRRSTLHTAREIKLVRRRLSLATDYTRQLTCAYFFEIIAMLVERNTPIEDLYELYLKGLDYLETHPSSHQLIERFERRLLTQLGLPHESLSTLQLRQLHFPKSPKSWKPLCSALAVPQNLKTET